MIWFHCVRCREGGVSKARRRASEDNLPAKRIAEIMQVAKLVCGWRREICHHKAHCLKATPPAEVLSLISDAPVLTGPEAASKAPDDIKDICRRMESLSQEDWHKEKAEQYEIDKRQRDERAHDMAMRAQALGRLDLEATWFRKQKRSWDAKLSQGMVPVRKDAGRPITRDQFDNLFAGKDRAPDWQLVQSFGFNSVLAGMDAFHRGGATYAQKEKQFFNIVRRIERGLGVDWVTFTEAKENNLRALDWDNKRGPYLAQAECEESDLPIEWYDGGDSKKWEQKQKESQMRYKQKEMKTQQMTVADLLGGIGKNIKDA